MFLERKSSVFYIILFIILIIFFFRLARLSCLCVCSLFLPCLWCYPLLKGTSLLVERAYQAATRHGCTCSDENSTSTALRRNIGLNYVSNSSSNNSASHDLSTASSTSPLAAAEDKRLLS